MLQINLHPYASDALEDAMRLAQTKALNSYSWSDMLNYLNYAWRDMYQKLAQQDEGFYSKTVQLRERLTKLPPFLASTIKIYAAQRPIGFNREIFRASGYNDLQSIGTYHISGFDLYCPDATRRTVWLNYVPQPPQIFFTRNNRDPKLFEPNNYTTVRKSNYNLYDLRVFKDGIQMPNDYLTTCTRNDIKTLDGFKLIHRDISLAGSANQDITDYLQHNEDTKWQLCYISCDFPYIFVTYQHLLTGECLSGFFRDILDTVEFVEYNPFAYTGRNSNVEYVEVGWNDKTGLGVTIIDYNDQNRFKQLGWTPDTRLTYPAPEMYRLLVALLADKLSALNESNIMGVQKELTEAQYAFVNFIKKDKSSWQRIDNVNGPTVGDML